MLIKKFLIVLLFALALMFISPPTLLAAGGDIVGDRPCCPQAAPHAS